MSDIRIFAFADESSAMIDHQIVAMKRNGLSGLEIRNVDNANVASISAEKAKEVRKKLDDAGLITWSIGSPIGKIDIETGNWAAHQETFRHSLEIAEILGAKNFRLFSFFIPQGKNVEDYHNEVIDRMGTFAEIGKDFDVTLCHENEKGIYGALAPECLEILQAIPSIKGIFDPANFVQCGQDTLGAWKLLKPFIHYMHIKDALTDGSVVPAGEGAGNVKAIVSDFIANGGKEFTIEPHLSVFSGLGDLERKGEESKVGHRFVYANSDEAFDAACNAFKALLK